MTLLIWAAILCLSGSFSPQSIQNHGANPATNPQSAADRERSGADPLIDLPPLADSKATLIGGTIAKLDSVRDNMSLRAFGGKKVDVIFDVRTKIYRDGVPAHLSDLHTGDRAYVDTILNGTQVFAKAIRVVSKQNAGDARGQVVSYDGEHNVLTLREQISPNPLKFNISRNTVVMNNQRQGSLADLRPGSLVEITFAPGAQKFNDVQRINVLAAPGATFTFMGKITFVDLRLKKMAIANRSDNQTYEISLDSVPNAARSLREGVEATVDATFDGQGYKAKSIEVASSPSAEK